MDHSGTGFVPSILLTTVLLLTQSGCALVRTAPSDPTADQLRLTSLNAPLPREALKAKITFAYQPQQTFYANQKMSLNMLVQNVSSVAWPYLGQAGGKFQVRLANRWLDQQERAFDDGREELSYDLRPGDQEEVSIVVTAPSNPGEYILEFDMVQEYVTWFAPAGSETLRVKVTVE
jgi:hypothetical protein